MGEGKAVEIGTFGNRDGSAPSLWRSKASEIRLPVATAKSEEVNLPRLVEAFQSPRHEDAISTTPVKSVTSELKNPAQAKLRRGTLESRDAVRAGHPPFTKSCTRRGGRARTGAEAQFHILVAYAALKRRSSTGCGIRQRKADSSWLAGLARRNDNRARQSGCFRNVQF